VYQLLVGAVFRIQPANNAYKKRDYRNYLRW
jgi:hypothetical protein